MGKKKRTPTSNKGEEEKKKKTLVSVSAPPHTGTSVSLPSPYRSLPSNFAKITTHLKRPLYFSIDLWRGRHGLFAGLL